MQVTCPSGLIFEGRPWNRGDQRKLLQESQENESLLLPKRMVEMATVSVIDPGPYSFNAGGLVAWDEVTSVDIVRANVAIRIETDPIYLFQRNCQRCGALTDPPLEVDLREFEMRPASDEGKGLIQSRETKSVKLASTEGEVVVHLKPMRSREMVLLGKVQSQDVSALIDGDILMGIDRVTLPGGKEIQGVERINRFLDKQGWGFVPKLEAEVDQLWGWMDTEISWRCKEFSCRCEQKSALPLDLGFYGVAPPTKSGPPANPPSDSASAETTTPEPSSLPPLDSQTPPI